MISAQIRRVIGVFSFALFVWAQALGQESDPAAKIYSKAAKSVLLILLKSSDGHVVAQGTGFLVENGRIITNEHVIRGGTPVIDFGGVRIPATVELSDTVNDIAVLTTSAEISAEPLIFAEKTPPPGSNVFAIGNPHGLEKSISTGVVAGMRQAGARQLLQITTPISPGSSGGPVFDSAGKVLGITVGSIEGGQNLNFAVPAAAVVKLMRERTQERESSSALVETAGLLIDQRNQLEWSTAPDSPYQKLETQIIATLSTAIDRAGKDDVELLVRISTLFGLSFVRAETDIEISAAERSLRFKASPDISLVLAKALSWKAVLVDSAKETEILLERSENVARQAISASKQPSAEMYYTLGATLATRESYVEAEPVLRHALELNRTKPDVEQQADILRSLIFAAEGLKRLTDVDRWFSTLVQTGKATSWDWWSQATRLHTAKRFSEAGEAWQQAATLGKEWTYWCEAAGSFRFTVGKEDLALSTRGNAFRPARANQNPRVSFHTPMAS